MIDMGMKKKDRRNKRTVDEIAATIMLQEYMQTLIWFPFGIALIKQASILKVLFLRQRH